MLHVHIYIYSSLLHIYIYMVTPKSDDSWQLSLLKLSLDTTWGAHHGFLDLPGTGQFSGVVKAFNAKGPGSREWFPSAPHLTVLVSYLHGLWGLKKTSRCQWRVLLGFIVLFFLVSQLVCAFSMIIYGCVFAGDGQYRPVTVLASPVSLVMFFSQICWWDAFLVPYIIYPISIDISTLMDSHNIHTYVHL